MNNARRSLLVFVLLPVLAGCASDRAYKYGPQANPAYLLQMIPDEVAITIPFKYNKIYDGFTLLEDVPFDGKQFIPDIVEFLKPGERYVDRKMMWARSKDLNADLGQQQAEYLESHQELLPVEWRRKYILIFPGTFWQIPNGDQIVSGLFWEDNDNPHWSLKWIVLRGGFPDSARFVRLRK